MSPLVAAHPSAETPSEEQLRKSVLDAVRQVDDVILGKLEQVKLMFVALLAQGHVLLDDTPGMGKTLMARAMTAVLGMDLRRIQFTSDLMPSDIVGVGMLGGAGSSALTFQPGPIFTHALLADEINRASPRTQSALLEAMAERQVTVDGASHALPHPFWVIATQNPVDFSGTFPLPDSQMDRFLFRMNIGYPDEESEINLLLGNGGRDVQRRLHALLRVPDVVAIQAMVSQQHVSKELARYVYRLVEASRRHQEVTTGLSPRAGLSILDAAKAHSWMEARRHVLPEDVRAVFIPASIHRLAMSHHDFKHRHNVVKNILASTPCP